MAEREREEGREITVRGTSEIQASAGPMEDVDILAYAERKMEQLNKLTAIIVRRTSSQDWTDLGGKPWLCDSGAERIMPLFGICVDITSKLAKEEHMDEKGGYYVYRIYGRASIQGRMPWVDVSGSCSSRKAFFAINNHVERPQSESLPRRLTTSTLCHPLKSR